MIWLIGLVIVIILGIVGTIYLTYAIGRFGLIRKASGGKKWLERLMAFCVNRITRILPDMKTRRCPSIALFAI